MDSNHSPWNKIIKTKNHRDYIVERLYDKKLWVLTRHYNACVIITKDITYRELLEELKDEDDPALIQELIKRMIKLLPEPNDLYLHDHFNQPYNKSYFKLPTINN